MFLDERRNKIGVIVPLFNKENQIRRALDSIFNQIIPFDEVIIVDDCSTDQSLEIVILYKEKNPDFHFKIICHPINKGPGAARNTGISSMQCDLFCFLDSDDYFEQNFLKKVHENLELGQKELFLIFKVKEASSNAIRPCISHFRNYSRHLNLDVWEINNWVNAMVEEPLFCSGGNVILSKDVVGDIKFDEKTRNFEDWDFYFRICSNAVLNKIQIKFLDIIGLVYSDDDIYSLSRSKRISSSLLNIPTLIFNENIPIVVRKFTYGIWLLHVSQRIKWIDCFKIVYKILKDNHHFKPYGKMIFISIIASFLRVNGWEKLSGIRKKARYA